MHLGNLLHATAGRYAQKTALICGEESVTYQELDHAARRLARWFLNQGTCPGDRVAIHCANSVDTVKLMLACLHGGLIAVPVNIRLKALEVGYILEHSGASVCFSQPDLVPLAAAACAERGLRIPVRTGFAAGGR